MARERVNIGKRTPRYSFMINPYTDIRLSACPSCKKLTHRRKFVLFIHVDGWGPLALGKTCPYCTPCELIIVHRDELEAELERSPAHYVRQAKEDGYYVVGTVERKEWQKGLKGEGSGLHDILEHTADFKKRFDLHYEPAGWRLPAGKSD